MKCAVFASGGGSNFQALVERKNAGDLHVDFAVLIANNSTAGACDRARKHGIPVVHIAPSQYADENTYAARLQDALDSHGVELIVLAGYMKKVPSSIIQKYEAHILNIHPALLPAFGGSGMYGHFVHDAVIASGVKITGVTVHFVTECYDSGPILLQEPVRVLDGDTAQSLSRRVLACEHASYWRAIEAVARGMVRLENGKVYGKTVDPGPVRF